MSSPLTRRGFLLSASAFAATALVACGGGGSSSLGGAGDSELPLALETDPNRRLARVERHHFEGLVGAPFRMTETAPDARDVVNVTLASVVDSAATNPDSSDMGFREPFSLRLRGPEGRLVRDGTYVVNHPEIGDINVFVCFGGTVEEIDPSGDRVLRNAYRIHFN